MCEDYRFARGGIQRPGKCLQECSAELYQPVAERSYLFLELRRWKHLHRREPYARVYNVRAEDHHPRRLQQMRMQGFRDPRRYGEHPQRAGYYVSGDGLRGGKGMLLNDGMSDRGL